MFIALEELDPLCLAFPSLWFFPGALQAIRILAIPFLSFDSLLYFG